MTDLKVGEDVKITLHFSLKLDDGTVVDSTFDSDPASWLFGDGNLPEGFESFLVGMKKGEEAEFEVSPEKAFGQPNPNNIQQIPRNSFDAEMALEEGLVVSFADANQNELPGVVKSFNAEHVDVDFNHPLAGRTLNFQVHVINLEKADENQAG